MIFAAQYIDFIKFYNDIGDGLWHWVYMVGGCPLLESGDWLQSTLGHSQLKLRCFPRSPKAEGCTYGANRGQRSCPRRSACPANMDVKECERCRGWETKTTCWFLQIGHPKPWDSCDVLFALPNLTTSQLLSAECFNPLFSSRCSSSNQ